MLSEVKSQVIEEQRRFLSLTDQLITPQKHLIIILYTANQTNKQTKETVLHMTSLSSQQHQLILPGVRCRGRHLKINTVAEVMILWKITLLHSFPHSHSDLCCDCRDVQHQLTAD